MRHLFLTIATTIAVALTAVAQSSKNMLEIDQSSFRPVQTDVLTGVGIDKIGLDRSKRPCARIKLHVNRMTREEIDQLVVNPIGGMVELTKKRTSFEGNGIIFEITAKEQVRFYLHHDVYGDSNEVAVNLQANTEYLLDAQLNQLFTITVASNMKDADVYIDDRYCDKTNDDYVVVVHDVIPGEHTLRIEHAGRKAEQQILVHRDNVYFRCNVDTVEARPQFVVFEVEPKNAIVFIDNEPQSTQEGFAQALLQNGTYSWRVMAKGYHEQSGTLTVSGAKVTRKVTLTADAAMVTISAGEGSEIWINNERRGVSPWRGQLLSGTYLFEARKPGHRTTTLPQTITSTPAEQSYTLDAPTPIVGSITITSVPAMADIYIDGRRVGQTPMMSDLIIGEHNVELRREGCVTIREKVIIADGKTSNLDITLEKLSTATANGSSASTATVGPYKVGDYYNENGKEGVVFWVDTTGKQGKIVNMHDSPKELKWSTETCESDIVGAESKDNGVANMAAVKKIWGYKMSFPAFSYCEKLGDGWYLPAIDELRMFTLNSAVRDAVNRTLIAKGGSAIPNLGVEHVYWSSTEGDRMISNGSSRSGFAIWMEEGYDGKMYRGSKYYVRAIAVVTLKNGR